MKKLTTLLLLLALAVPTIAQHPFANDRERRQYYHTERENYFGIRFGFQVAALNSDLVDMDFNARTGLSVGGVYGLQLAAGTPIWLEVGAFYSEKGGRRSERGGDIKCRLNYLEFPIVFKYAFDVYDDLYLQPFIGGYLALGVDGKIKDYSSRSSYSAYDRVNRPDAGLRVGCGIQYQLFYAELGFDFGLANISKDEFDTSHTQSFFLNAGVNF
jgi:hypothetical protein